MDLEHFPTSPSAKRMLSSVSEEFYAKSYAAKWLHQVMGLEWDDVWAVIDALPEQAFVETATWGLMYHELKWGLPIRENMNYETRRRLIYEKRDVRKPMNPWAMEQILYDMTGRVSRVLDSNDDSSIPVNTFVVEIESAETALDICAVLRKLREIRQSHVAFTFLICSKVTVRIRTPTSPHRFPYRMTGEHPDINTIGDVERDRIQAGADGQGNIFPYPVAGPHLAGTLPEENTQGFIRAASAEVGAAGTGAVFPYTPAGVGVAGTLPDVNIPAHIRDAGLNTEASGEGMVFPYVQTGTKPEANTAGYVRRSGVRNGAEARGTVFPYPQAGTRPDENAAGIIQPVGIQSTPESYGTVFPYVPSGETDTGTCPNVNIPSVLRESAVQNAATGTGAAFAYPITGPHMSGTIPEEQSASAGNKTEVSGMAAGSGTVIDYPLCGEDDD